MRVLGVRKLNETNKHILNIMENQVLLVQSFALNHDVRCVLCSFYG